MEKPELTIAANEQLNRVLSFFPRVDTGISVLLSISIAMLALFISLDSETKILAAP